MRKKAVAPPAASKGAPRSRERAGETIIGGVRVKLARPAVRAARADEIRGAIRSFYAARRTP